MCERIHAPFLSLSAQNPTHLLWQYTLCEPWNRRARKIVYKQMLKLSQRKSRPFISFYIQNICLKESFPLCYTLQNTHLYCQSAWISRLNKGLVFTVSFSASINRFRQFFRASTNFKKKNSKFQEQNEELIGVSVNFIQSLKDLKSETPLFSHGAISKFACVHYKVSIQ